MRGERRKERTYSKVEGGEVVVEEELARHEEEGEVVEEPAEEEEPAQAIVELDRRWEGRHVSDEISKTTRLHSLWPKSLYPR